MIDHAACHIARLPGRRPRRRPALFQILLVASGWLAWGGPPASAQQDASAESTEPAAATSDGARDAAATREPSNSSAADGVGGQLEQQALAAAIADVADTVVQIRTVGGLQQVEGQQVAAGPTTGTIVRSDGYIVSSAYGFVQQPASILVRLPDGNFVPAQLVGHDRNRMLVLLKVEAPDPLPTPVATPLDEIEPGWRTAALGRTFDAQRVNVSIGVVSALGRMYGRALQTDAAVSAANYGGPLIDLYGRVLGVIAPFAPEQGGVDRPSVLAGVQFYDSGIGFAAPLEHVLNDLDRWIAEGELQRGRLGIGLAKGNAHAAPAKITAIWPQSPAADAGWRKGDVIVAVDGVPTETQTRLRMAIVPRYAGDQLRVIVQREDQEIETIVTLAAELPKYRPAFLGILPSRAETDDGVLVAGLWPASPAATAGMAPGDRIVTIDKKPVKDRADAVAALEGQTPGDSVEVEFRRGNELSSVDVRLAPLPNDVLSAGQMPVRQDEADAPQPADAVLKLESIKLPDLPHEAWYYAPAQLPASPGMLVVLASVGQDEAQQMAEQWRAVCDQQGWVLLIASPGGGRAWEEDDLQYLVRLLSLTKVRFGVDAARVVLAGEKKAGQLAAIAALKAKRLASAVVCIEAPLPRSLTIPATMPGERIAFLSISGRDSPFGILVEKDVKGMVDAGYSATHLTPRVVPELATISSVLQQQVARWIDALDRF